MTSDDQWLSPEPVAWRYLTRNGWSVTTVKGVADFQQSEGFVVEPLYTALAQSDAEPEQWSQLRNELRNAIQSLETCRASEEGWKKRCQFVEAERDEARAALSQSNAEPIARARYHLRAADHAMHEVEGDPFADHAHTLVHEAAFMITDEPELQVLRRLPESGAVLAQSDAEPVAWRYAYPGYPGHWNVTSDKLTVDERQGNADCIVEPLYTAPPRSDASAGLIEAAEYCEKEISQWSGDAWSKGVGYGLKIAARYLRGAADRSGK